MTVEGPIFLSKHRPYRLSFELVHQMSAKQLVSVLTPVSY